MIIVPYMLKICLFNCELFFAVTCINHFYFWIPQRIFWIMTMDAAALGFNACENYCWFNQVRQGLKPPSYKTTPAKPGLTLWLSPL